MAMVEPSQVALIDGRGPRGLQRSPQDVHAPGVTSPRGGHPWRHSPGQPARGNGAVPGQSRLRTGAVIWPTAQEGWSNLGLDRFSGSSRAGPAHQGVPRSGKFSSAGSFGASSETPPVIGTHPSGVSRQCLCGATSAATGDSSQALGPTERRRPAQTC